jgi:cyanate permease
MSGSCGTYGFLFFLPLILRKGLGYSQSLSFCLTAPPAAVAVIYALTISWAADKYRVRGPFILMHCVLGIVGLCMIGFLDPPTPRYIGSFLGECGTNGLIVTGLAWGQNNVRGDAKRSVATAIQVMMAAVGGIYSALVFRQQVSSLQALLKPSSCL